MAWNQRCAHKRWDPEERCSQAGTHFHYFAKARLKQRAEFVRGGSSKTFVPKVDVGVAPSKLAATKPVIGAPLHDVTSSERIWTRRVTSVIVLQLCFVFFFGISAAPLVVAPP